MNALQQFLSTNVVDNLTQEINLGGRLKDFTFRVKAITGDQYNSYQSICIENPNSAKKRRFNTKKFNELIVTNHVVDPSFKDAEWLQQMQAPDAATLMYRTLLAGEINELSEKIMKLSGFDSDLEEEIDEAKN
jgi:hypothetical protein